MSQIKRFSVFALELAVVLIGLLISIVFASIPKQQNKFPFLAFVTGLALTYLALSLVFQRTRNVTCRTDSKRRIHNFSALFEGPEEDIPAFYGILNQVRQHP